MMHDGLEIFLFFFKISEADNRLIEGQKLLFGFFSPKNQTKSSKKLQSKSNLLSLK